MARRDRLKLEKVGPTFSSLTAIPAKTDHQKIVMAGATGLKQC